MQTPSYLQPGDCIGIVSTARKISLEEIKPAISLLKNWGLTVKIGKTIGAEDHQFAGNTVFRKNDFQNMLNDPTIKAVWCARGGYGTVKIVDLLEFSEFKKQPKWIIGYSDITVLHSCVHNLNIESLHAMMPIDLSAVGNGISEMALKSFKNTLFGKKTNYRVAGASFNKEGVGNGVLIGGNLSILYSLCGSDSSINTEGKILFLEDLDEYLYHIDRMLQNLKRNGMFEGLNGLLIGGMTKMHDNTIAYGKIVEEIILDVASNYRFPVAFNFPAGHIKDNQALIMGRSAELTVLKNNVCLRYNN